MRARTALALVGLLGACSLRPIDGYFAGADGGDGGDDVPPCADPALLCAVDLAAGDHHACAVSPDGGVTCWGDNGAQQLGWAAGAAEPFSPRPVRAAVGAMRRVAAGEAFSCAASPAELRCWGFAAQGALGIGVDEQEEKPPTPVLLDAGLVLDLQARGRSACALVAGGEPWCWGRGDYGHLLRAGAASALAPVQLPLAPQAQLALAEVHACALSGAGEVRCWGDPSFDKLGGQPTDAGETVTVDPQSSVAEVCGGKDWSCARLSSGEVTCWGLRDFGDPARLQASTPLPTQLAALPAARRIFCRGQTFCLIDASERVVCQGANEHGQVGLGSTADAGSAFVLGNTTPVPGPSGVAQVAIGAASVCARERSGAVWCWGDNARGQLGAGDAGPQAGPVRVVAPR